MSYVRLIVLAVLLIAVMYFIYTKSAVDPYAILAYNARNFSDLETFPQLAQNPDDGTWRADYFTPGGVLHHSSKEPVRPLVHFTINDKDEWVIGEDEQLKYSVRGRDVLVNGKKFHTVTNPRFIPYVDENNVIRFREDHPCDREDKFALRTGESSSSAILRSSHEPVRNGLVSGAELREYKNFFRSAWRDFPDSVTPDAKSYAVLSKFSATDRVAVAVEDDDDDGDDENTRNNFESSSSSSSLEYRKFPPKFRAADARRPLFRDDLIRYGYDTGEVYDDSRVARTYAEVRSVRFFESRESLPHPKSYWNCATRKIETCPEGQFDPDTGKCYTERSLIRYVDPDEYGSVTERRRTFASLGSDFRVMITIDVELRQDVMIRAKVSLGAAKEFRDAALAKRNAEHTLTNSKQFSRQQVDAGSNFSAADPIDVGFSVKLSDIGEEAFSRAVQLPAIIVWHAQRLSNDVTFRLVDEDHEDGEDDARIYAGSIVEVLSIPIGKVLVNTAKYSTSAEWFDPSRDPFVNVFTETETYFGCFLYEKLEEIGGETTARAVPEMFCEGYFGNALGITYFSTSEQMCASGRSYAGGHGDLTPVASPLIVDTLLKRRGVTFEYARNPGAAVNEGTFTFRDKAAEEAYYSFSSGSDVLAKAVDVRDRVLNEAAFSTRALWAKVNLEKI